MPLFLSAEWFAELHKAASAEQFGSVLPVPAGEAPEAGPPGPPEGAGTSEASGLVVEIVVAGAPQGEVRYQVVVGRSGALVLSPRAAHRPARVQFNSDYATMAGIASGGLLALEALSHGRAHVSGDISALSAHSVRLAGLDLMPPALRASTTY